MKKSQASILITGGNTGLGYECAKVIAASHPEAHLIIASRNKERVEAAVSTLRSETGHVHISGHVVDLGSSASIRKLAQDYTSAGYPPLQAIVCNAGAQFVQGTQTTADGMEATFGLNHMGHFLLVRLLLGQMLPDGRIMVVSSGTHDPAKRSGMPAPRYADPGKLADPGLSDALLTGLAPGTAGRIRYTTSKLCNLYFVYELAKRLADQHPGMIVAGFDPGMMPGIGSALSRDYTPGLRFVWHYVLPALRPFHPGVRSTRQSGAHLARLLTSPQVTSGSYWDGKRQIPSSAESYDRSRAERLWSWSSERFGLSPEI